MKVIIFFNSYAGMYIAQSICHALVSAFIVDRLLYAWKVNNPLIKQRFRYIVIIFPFFSFPLYQLVNPERDSIFFRLESLFDINRWLNLQLLDIFPLSFLFIFILLITAIVSLLQEIIPVFIHSLKSNKSTLKWKKPDKDSPVIKALDSLQVEKPDIFITDDDDAILFSRNGRNAAIYLSTGIVNMLNTEQIQAALSHEICHIARNKKPLILTVLLLRILMFFNPVVLIEFRKIVQDEEKICDDMSVNLTQKPHALAESLKKLYYTKDDISSKFSVSNMLKLGTAIEEYSHNFLIKTRIIRLENVIEHKTEGEWFKFAVTLAVIILINYFVV